MKDILDEMGRVSEARGKLQKYYGTEGYEMLSPTDQRLLSIIENAYATIFLALIDFDGKPVEKGGNDASTD